eukprot:jgi/Ulvmu1/4306/UM002_0027.1
MNGMVSATPRGAITLHNTQQKTHRHSAPELAHVQTNLPAIMVHQQTAGAVHSSMLGNTAADALKVTSQMPAWVHLIHVTSSQSHRWQPAWKGDAGALVAGDSASGE